MHFYENVRKYKILVNFPPLHLLHHWCYTYFAGLEPPPLLHPLLSYITASPSLMIIAICFESLDDQIFLIFSSRHYWSRLITGMGTHRGWGFNPPPSGKIRLKCYFRLLNF